MTDQRVGLTLVVNNAAFLPQMAASNAEVAKLQAGLDKLAASAQAAGLGSDAATAGVGALGAGAAGAAAEVGRLGEAAGVARGTIAGAGASSEAASVGTANLGRSSAVASTEVGNLGRASIASRAEIELLGASGEIAGGRMAKGFGLAAKSIPLLTVVALGEAAKMAGDFQQETNVLVTAAGESADALGAVRKGILDISAGTGTGIKDLTDGMYQVEKAGYRGADGLKILKASAQAAREEGANLATVTAATTSVMASYHQGAGDAVAVTNEIKTAAGEAKTTMELFAGSLSTVLPLASANHITFADVAGSLASLTQHGTTADQAAQELAFTIRGLAAPNNVAVATMGQLGISATDVATKLGDGPGGRGLAGTLNYLSQTVLERMGPNGLILLDTFKKSTTAANDLTQQLDAMAPKTRELAQQFIDGSITAGDFKASTKDLTGDQAVLARQFTVTYNQAHGFNDAIKRGGADSVTFSDQIKKITGGAAGLNTVLQLTGESMAGTNDRIAKIAASASGAGDDVAGWASTQKLFNVQMAEFARGVQVAAIDVGTKLLPVLGATFGFLGSNKTVLEGVAIAVGGAAVAITGYTVAVKLASLATATWSGLTTAVRTGYLLLTGQTTLFTLALSVETRAKIASAQAGLAMNASLIENATAARLATGAVTGFGAALGAVVRGGIIVGASVAAITFATDKLVASFEKAQPSVEHLVNDLLRAGKGGSTSGLVADLDGLGKSVANLQRNADPSLWDKTKIFFTTGPSQAAGFKDAQKQLKGLDDALAGLVKSGNMTDAGKAFGAAADQAAKQGVSTSELVKLLPAYRGALGDVLTKQQDATGTTDDLTQAQKDLKSAQDDLNNALQGSIDKFTILNGGALSVERASENLTTKTDALTQSVKANGTSLDVNTSKGQQNRSAIVDLFQAANDKITSDFKSVESTQGYSVALDQAGKAADVNRQHMVDLMVQHGFTRKSAEDMANQFLLTPQEIKTQFLTPGLADAQGKVDALQESINALHGVTIPINAAVAIGTDGKINVGLTSKLSHLPGAATGGEIRGPGTGTSDSILGIDAHGIPTIRVSAGEHVIPVDEVAKLGGHEGMYALRHAIRGLAAGGPVISVQGGSSFGALDTLGRDITGLVGQVRAANAAAAAASYGGTPGAAGGAARWAPVVDQVLTALGLPMSLEAGILSLINKESGGNPNAKNMTDSNAKAGHPSQGLMQTIVGTFLAYAGPYRDRGILDPFANIYAGVNYANQKYGQGMLAAGGRHSADGGYLGYETGTPYVPQTGLALIHEGERVMPKAENRDYTAWVHGMRLATAAATTSSSTSSSRKVEVLVRATTDDTVAHAVSGAISKDLRNQAAVNGFRL